MKRNKLLILSIILICFFALTSLTSCDAVLDLIFGPKNPSNPSNPNEPPACVHQMEEQTFVGQTCKGQSEITYYKCSKCGKCYLDEAGTDEIVLSELDKGHLYVIKIDGDEHYSECHLCKEEQQGSRAKHSSDRWWYNPEVHYKQCDVCSAKFDEGAHDETGSCSVCGRQADYEAICSSRYGYGQLAALEHGKNMQKLYDRIDEAVRAFHNDETRNAAVPANSEGPEKAIDEVTAFDLSLTVSEARAAVAVYGHDNPLYYWIDKTCLVGVGKGSEGVPDGSKLALNVNICVADGYANGEDRVAQNNKLYAQIDGYLSAVSNENDPYYISLALHDMLINSVDYAYKSDGVTPESALWAHSIEGVFVNEKAVCEGYAKAYQLLLNACGVNNVYVTGSSFDTGHAWNMVQLNNGNWYLYDLTWDDQPNDAEGQTHKYFCNSVGTFNSDHTPTPSNIADGLDYLYPLPDAASADYQTESLELNESFTVQGISYKFVGYNRVSVCGCTTLGENGILTIPSTVREGGRTLTVSQIDNEAFATYAERENGVLYPVTSINITKLIIPQTVTVIYTRSLRDCETLVSVEFADCENWRRRPLTNQSNSYAQLNPDELAIPSKACALLKQEYKTGLLPTGYAYVWEKIS